MELKGKITSFVVGENKYNSGVDTVMFITVWGNMNKILQKITLFLPLELET